MKEIYDGVVTVTFLKFRHKRDNSAQYKWTASRQDRQRDRQDRQWNRQETDGHRRSDSLHLPRTQLIRRVATFKNHFTFVRPDTILSRVYFWVRNSLNPASGRAALLQSRNSLLLFVWIRNADFWIKIMNTTCYCKSCAKPSLRIICKHLCPIRDFSKYVTTHCDILVGKFIRHISNIFFLPTEVS